MGGRCTGAESSSRDCNSVLCTLLPPVLVSTRSLAPDWRAEPPTYLAGVLLAFGVSCAHHAFGYDGVVVVVTGAVAKLLTYDSHSDFSQGIRECQNDWVGGAPASDLAFGSGSNVIFGAWWEQLDILVEFCGRVKLTD